jgi:hypothetical protein
MISMTDVKVKVMAMPKQYIILISIVVLVVLFMLYRKHQSEKMGNTIGDRHTAHSGFAWW